MSNTKVSTVDEYIALFEGEPKRRLEAIRKIIREVAPQAEEVISYGMPAYKYSGESVHKGIFFSGFTKHIGLYPLPAHGPEKFNKQLKPHIEGKGTARFYHNKPLPLELIREFALLRLAR